MVEMKPRLEQMISQYLLWQTTVEKAQKGRVLLLSPSFIVMMIPQTSSMRRKDRNVNAKTSESHSESSQASQSGDETSADATLAEESAVTSSDYNASRKSSTSNDRRQRDAESSDQSKPEKADYSKFTDLLSDSVLDINSNYDYPKKLVKDYKLDLAAELQTKLDEVRVQYDVLNYKLSKSKTTCVNLERENKRLRKQLQLQNEYEVKTGQVLLKHATDLNEIRARYRDTKAELEKIKMGTKPVISWRPKKQKSPKKKTMENSASAKSEQDSLGDDLNADVQINNNRRSSTMLHPIRRPSRSRTKHARTRRGRSKGTQFAPSHHLNSNRRELHKDPIVILHAPIIGRKSTKRSRSEGHLNRRERSLNRRQLALPTNKVNSYRTVRDWQRYNTVSPKKHSKSKNRHASYHKKSLPVRPKHSPVWKKSPVLLRRHSPNILRQGRKRFQPLRYQSFSVPRQSKSVPTRGQSRRKAVQRHRSLYSKRPNKSTNNLGLSNENNHAIQLLNSMLEGVHFNSKKKLFLPGKLSDTTGQRHISILPSVDPPVATLSNLGIASTAAVSEHPLKAKASRESVNTKRYVRMIHAKLDDLNSRKKLNKNEVYIKDQYKKLLLSNVRQTGHFLPYKQKPLNQNNNADDPEHISDRDDLSDQSKSATQLENPQETLSNVGLAAFSSAMEDAKEQLETNDNDNAASAVFRPVFDNVNTNASYGDLHPEVSRLQHLLNHKEIHHHEFLSAFTDALVAKEAAVDLAEEQQDTIHMLDREMSKMRDEYEDIIHIKNNEIDLQNEVLSSYKDERFSLTKALEKATKCMVNKLQAKNAALRKKNMAHHDEISELRRIALQQEAQLKNLTETLQRVKIFHEREVAIFNTKIRQLYDLTKTKEAEIHNYQQISSDVVHMAEQMNLDLHIKDEIIKQLRNDLANFEVGLNEVEGDRVLVKQNRADKRVTSLGFPRIVDGSLVIWYKSRSHGDNFLVLRIFGGKLFVVEKSDILPELNRILPNLVNSPIFTHAVLKLDKGTQWPTPKQVKLES
ncbi:putative leucine-rich repeat-containing protein DDB_G0290503 [Watersipora subatra]|uniref:putative leucine-rich repeat-containing protein DDB_G0290503 n=1 Tax=Watersipora subatra TaxID=2589382 RepID=UPI00355C2989